MTDVTDDTVTAAAAAIVTETIYIVIEESGEYDDYGFRTICWCATYEEALAEVKRLESRPLASEWRLRYDLVAVPRRPVERKETR